MADIDINDERLKTFISQDTYADLNTIYVNASKKQKQLIGDLATIAPLLLQWVPLIEAEALLPYRQIHRVKYVCGTSQKGAQISRLCCDKDRQRYMGQWLNHKALIMHGKKYVKYVKLSSGAIYIFQNMLKTFKKDVIKTA